MKQPTLTKVLPYLVALWFGIALTGCSTFTSSSQAFLAQRELSKDSALPLNLTRQREPHSCGSAALSSVLGFWGQDVTEEWLLKQYPPSSSLGYSVAELRAIARAMGLQSYAIRGNLKILSNELIQARPAMLLVKKPMDPLAHIPLFDLTKPLRHSVADFFDAELDHYWVVIGQQEKRFIIADPSSGIQFIDQSVLMDAWKKAGLPMLVFKGNLDKAN